MWGGANWLKKKNKRKLKKWNRRYIKWLYCYIIMIIIITHYSKNTHLYRKKRIKPKHYNRWVNCLHTHKHSTINVELLLAALRAKTRTIVNLKLLQRVALLFFLPANSLTHPSGRTQKISANVKGAFLLPSRMGTGGGNYQWSKWPLKFKKKW